MCKNLMKNIVKIFEDKLGGNGVEKWVKKLVEKYGLEKFVGKYHSAPCTVYSKEVLLSLWR